MFSKLSKSQKVKVNHMQKSKRLTRQKICSIIVVVLWAVLSYAIASGLAFVSILAAVKLGWIGAEQSSLMTIVAGVITYITSILALFLGTYLAKKYPRLAILKVKKTDWAVGGWLTWQQLFLGVAAFVAAMVLVVVMLLIVSQVIPGFDIEQAQDLGVDPHSIYNRTEMLAIFVLFVVVAPISEELMFRGYLYGKLRQSASVVVSTIIVSILFGLAHGQANVAVVTFAMSIVMCLCREATGSIYPAIIVHVLKNGLAFVALFMQI